MHNNILRLALRKAKATEKPEAGPSASTDPLEQAMEDYSNASNSTERAAAFRAAIELAK